LSSNKSGAADALRGPLVAYDPMCAAEKCVYAYQCGNTLFVCWNVIDPQYLGLEDLRSSSASAFFMGLESIIHCNDFKHNRIKVNPYCGSCVWGGNLLPMAIVRTAICPNGEAVTGYIQFCTPPTSVTTGVLTKLFCDFGDASFYHHPV
jgi:hypothetical protein